MWRRSYITGKLFGLMDGLAMGYKAAGDEVPCFFAFSARHWINYKAIR